MPPATKKNQTTFTADDLVQPIDCVSGTTDDGQPWVVNPNDLFRGDHPIVQQCPQHFRPASESRQRPTVEQATRAPGEQR